MDPKLATILKSLGHVALGGAVAAVAPSITSLIPLIPHIDPMTAMILGSAFSSLISAWFKPPNAGSNGGAK